jgi:hypothetical protein
VATGEQQGNSSLTGCNLLSYGKRPQRSRVNHRGLIWAISAEELQKTIFEEISGVAKFVVKTASANDET